MFHPTANRLAGFLEISALSISLGKTGGSQAKGGYLRIDASGSKGGGFGRKSARWTERKQSKWCAVRESYLVVLEQPGEVRRDRLRLRFALIICTKHSSQCGTSFSWTLVSR